MASSSENNLAERSVFSTPPAQSNVSNSKSGGSKGWAALRGAGAAQAAQVVAQEEQEAKTAQRSEGSVRFQVADEDDKREHADNKAFQEWLARRKASNRLRGAESVETEGSVPAVAEEEDSEASAPRGIILCPFLPQFKRKQKKKTRRQTVQEYFYQVCLRVRGCVCPGKCCTRLLYNTVAGASLRQDTGLHTVCLLRHLCSAAVCRSLRDV